MVSARYIVDDVGSAVAFYRDRLGFEVKAQPGPGFAMLACACSSTRPAARVGPGRRCPTAARQILVEDPAGNLVELFEPVS